MKGDSTTGTWAKPRAKYLCSKHFRKESPALVNALIYDVEPHVEIDSAEGQRCSALHCTSQARLRILLGPIDESGMHAWVKSRRYPEV